MKKIIAWENWSEIEKDLTDESIIIEDIEVGDEEGSELSQLGEFLLPPMLSEMKPQVIHTPFGVVSYDSKLKPSDRWDCWLGYTNFGITEDFQNKLKKIDGIDALRVMSRYTFCIGVGKLFTFTEVRRKIENEICKR